MAHYDQVKEEILSEIKDIESELTDVEITIPDPKDGFITDSKEDLIIIEESGVMRDRKTGQYVKGTISGPGKQGFKNLKLDKLIVKECGPDAEMLIQKILKIALYDPDKEILVKDEKTGLQKYIKKVFHFYNANVQMQALTLLMKYYYGNPRKEIQIDQNVDIKIEKKVADITKLINDNQDRLKIVK